MTNEIQNKFAAILAQAQAQAKTKTVLKSAQAKPAPLEQTKPVERPKLSTVTFEDVIKEVTPIEQPPIDLQIFDYNDRSFAVIGKGTKREKDKLKSLGGTFNNFLKCGPGWIFSKKRLALVKSNYPNL